jgi:raffinose/stachyose/melibiose transport system permease protein
MAITQSPVSTAGASFGQLIQNLKDVINNVHFEFWYAFGSSVVITVVSLVLLALFGSMAAWVICRNKTKWSTAIYYVFIASMIIPFQAVMLALISTFRDAGNFIGIPMLRSIPGTIFAYCGFGGAMTVFILTGFIKGIPYELEEAASIDGCSPEAVFFRIIFPLLKPVIVTVTILNGMWIWNDYLLPSLLLGSSSSVKTLPVAIQSFVGSFVVQWNLILAAALLTITPMIIIFLLAQKQIIAGMVDGAIK